MRIMIVGAGQVGRHLCEKLSVEGQEVVLVDQDDAKLRRLERELNILPVQGSGASTRILEEAGIDKTDLFIAVTDSDEVNLVACIISKQYNVKTRIARVRNEDFYSKDSALSEKALGIDLLISPDHAMADEIVRLSIFSEAFEVAEFAGGHVVLLGYVVHDCNPCIGVPLEQLKTAESGLRFVIAAIVRGDTTIIPRGSDKVEEGDKIYIVVRKSDISAVEPFLFNCTSKAPERVFVIGGGSIGCQVARQLEDKGINVRLVDKDPHRCDTVTEQLNETVVLNFDGLEAHDLLDEGIDRADLVISVTNSDTSNILSSLLAKHHGAQKCITHITRPDFIPLLGKLGIDVALSPRLVAANMILRFVRGGGSIVSVASLLGSDAEVVELKVPDSEKFRGMPIKSLYFPRGSIVGAIVRGHEVIIPSGETTVEADDSLVVFFTKEAQQVIEATFS